MYRIGMICEGPTDRVILEAILDRYADDYEAIPIQPPVSAVGGGDAGPFGGGWKGIRTWCQQETTGGNLNILTENFDLIIIQIDADVLHDTEVNEILPCPPPESRANAMRRLIYRWLGLDMLPEKIICCVPTMTSETWSLVALFPNELEVIPCNPEQEECIECRLEVKSLLHRLGKKFSHKLVVSQNGRWKNQREGYEKQQKKIRNGWDDVIKICTQAERFDNELKCIIRQ